ncbi:MULTISPECIES: hypothetical protein [Niastella]|uniref:Thiamine-binding protein domain-containing protein n=1 Tax=Niastella soli TaxID=2821487 RepID=A0ABS3YM26_9BACT|nr:hypothetical protein [Niastella soli]MBO9198894.1 hypothetical protein [Niastella soli]
MEPQYEIIVSMRLPEGYVEAGRFNITGGYEAAVDLFSQLNGEVITESLAPIRFDLLEIKDTLSTVLQTRFAVLCEASENCKVILRETFRILMLKPVTNIQ